MSHEAEDFVRRLLVADPGLRMTVEEAQHHPWIRSTNNCEPSIGCAKILSSALLVVFVLTATISLHIYPEIVTVLFICAETPPLGEVLWQPGPCI